MEPQLTSFMRTNQKKCHMGLHLGISSTNQRGAALVFVLALLFLLAGLVVSFFSVVTNDASSSDVYSNDAKAKQLSDSVVNLVMGQIVEATKAFKTNAGNPDYTQPLAWASQPGAIRTFDAHGAPCRLFKLYSAQNLVESGSVNPSKDAPLNSGWANDTAIFTDLNAPVKDLTGNNVYPIVDPTALGSVEGFSIGDTAPIAGGSNSNPAPMPVRWLYMLKDGNLTIPSAGSGSMADFSNSSPKPEATNPIVARVAFWTDDETSKLNINTASEGTYWDVPRFGTAADRDLASYQPTQGEYQRYEGHPAMTSLAPVFFAANATTTPTLTATQRDAIYSITPRVAGGGSQAGTVHLALGQSGPTLDKDRLYASVDELMFAPPVTSGARPEQDANAQITPAHVRQRAFFLTANSRAPEVNLFNQPRIAIWPVDSDLAANPNSPRATAFDRLLAFCSTIHGSTSNPYRFFFQRSNYKSTTADWINIQRNRELLKYLQRLTNKEIPGFGNSFLTKLGQADRDQLLVEILDYVRCCNLYDDHILPNLFTNQADATPPKSYQFTPGRYFQTGFGILTYPGHGHVAPLRVPSDLGSTYPPDTSTSPDDQSYMGFGRYGTISEAALLFICTGDGSAGTTAAPLDSPLKPDGYDDRRRESNQAANRTLGGMLLGKNEKRIQAMLLFELFLPSPSAPCPDAEGEWFCEVEQVGGTFQVQGKDLGIPAIAKVYQTNQSSSSGFIRFIGNTRKTKQPLVRDVSDAFYNASPIFTYDLVGAPITIDTTTPMSFKGPQNLVVRIYQGSPTSPGPLIQTLNMKFPDGDFPIPELKVNAANYQKWWAINSSGAGVGAGGTTGRLAFYSSAIIQPEDTVRSLAPYHGDYRLVAGSHVVSQGVFQPTSFYFTNSRANGAAIATHLNEGQPLMDNCGFYIPPASESLVPGVTYYSGSGTLALPDFPVTLNAQTQARVPAVNYQTTGDFDTAMVGVSDGAYINKPDEGFANGADGTADAGNIAYPYFTKSSSIGRNPFVALFNAGGGPTYFTPNRQIPSPGIFGSLPVKLRSGNIPLAASNPGAWRTLLFRPQPGHPGAQAPADHLLMDLFWMPVVEPYAISEPFSTAGKINMNYAIAPFDYIRRATGIASLLRSEKIIAIPTSMANTTYKQNGTANTTNNYRLSINTPETLKGFDARFNSGKLFVSASEICDLDLIPTGQTYPLSSSFWNTNALTGDNARERPYTTLYGRLTTKSNTYTIHYRVQVLKKISATPANQWVEGKDASVAESRGSVLIERYIDPNDSRLPDFATEPDPATLNLDAYYRFRVVQSRIFAP